jgi:hypothetical protein
MNTVVLKVQLLAVESDLGLTLTPTYEGSGEWELALTGESKRYWAEIAEIMQLAILADSVDPSGPRQDNLWQYARCGVCPGCATEPADCYWHYAAPHEITARVPLFCYTKCARCKDPERTSCGKFACCIGRALLAEHGVYRVAPLTAELGSSSFCGIIQNYAQAHTTFALHVVLHGRAYVEAEDLSAEMHNCRVRVFGVVGGTMAGLRAATLSVAPS